MYSTQEIVKRIKSQLKTKGIPVKEMLAELNLGINAISEFAKGKQMSCITLARIADYLDCSVDYLLGREDKKETANTAEYVDLFEKLTLEQQSLVLSQLKGILSARGS